jgi:enoyl-CoA hydratase
MNYTRFKIEIDNSMARVMINRPEKANALDLTAWEELQAVFEDLDTDTEVRVIILSGEGKHFCSGIDLELLMSVQQMDSIDCEGRKREQLKLLIATLQNSVTAIEKCRKPVLAAIHNGCIGGAVDIISACDMRFSTRNAYFSIKEIDMGMVADLGTLQRMPKLISPGLVAELAYTGRNLSSREALACGLVNAVYDNKEQMIEAVREKAAMIAAKSPLSIRGTKEQLLYARDHSVAEGLQYMQLWNSAFLLSNDLKEAFKATVNKQQPEFGD